MISPTTEKLIKQLKKSNLTLEDRNAIVTVLLDKLVVLPLNNTLVINHKGIVVNGKPLEQEVALNFVESCHALKGNMARNIIREQMKFLAINLGIHNAVSLDTMYFAKAALWNIQQEDELLQKIID